MKRKELTKTYNYDFELKNPFGFHGLYKHVSALQGLGVEDQSTYITYPANTRRSPNVETILAQRRRRLANIVPTLGGYF